MDVAIVIPAYRAEKTIRRAVQSVQAQTGITSEIVICADDDLDYTSSLKDLNGPTHPITFCRTRKPRSGPPCARNIAVAHSRAEVIASLDADDEFSPGRLRRLLPLVAETGVATGPTIEISEDRAVAKIGRPKHGAAFLTVDDISTIRFPYAPVFHRSLLGDGWPQVVFAEDMIFNTALLVRAGAYAFSPAAAYRYYQSPTSISGQLGAVRRAISGYKQILASLDSFDWPPSVRNKIREVILEDLARASAGSSISWRDAVRLPE
jgi:succinoglycan biosynthesis protein ExoO